MKLLLLWVCSWVAFSDGFRFLKQTTHGLEGIFQTLDVLSGNGEAAPKRKNISQKVNHFNPTDRTVWYQYYWEYDEFYVDNGPIFLNINGESSARPLYVTSTSWHSHLAKYKAMGFLLEHRYYGDSRPFDNLSTRNLTHLNSEQALADTAYFIATMNREHNFPATTKWVIFGGSYAGTLAAWMRIKYPHLVHAAYASSAPLFAKADFFEYLQVVRDSLASYDRRCVSALADATRRLDAMARTKIGRKLLRRTFNLCDELTGQKNISLFFSYAADAFSNAVQYYHPKFHPEMKRLCDIMMNTNYTLMERYGQVIGADSSRCLEVNYDGLIDINRIDETTRAWFYQTCTEFGWYQTSSKHSGPFGRHLTLPFFTGLCKDLYGSKFNVELINSGIERTNIMFGGFDVTARRILFIHGSMDPWHILGITESKSNKPYRAIYINGTAHCTDFLRASKNDSPEMEKARVKIDKILKSWLS